VRCTTKLVIMGNLLKQKKRIPTEEEFQAVQQIQLDLSKDVHGHGELFDEYFESKK
jgi:hypothetical protein